MVDFCEEVCCGLGFRAFYSMFGDPSYRIFILVEVLKCETFIVIIYKYYV